MGAGYPKTLREVAFLTVQALFVFIFELMLNEQLTAAMEIRVFENLLKMKGMLVGVGTKICSLCIKYMHMHTVNPSLQLLLLFVFDSKNF